MASIVEQMMSELETSIRDLLDNLGKHEGDCTNAAQVKIAIPIPACTKHQKALDARKARVESALMQFNVLRNLFTEGFSNDQRNF